MFQNFRKKHFCQPKLRITKIGDKFVFLNKSHPSFMILPGCDFLGFSIFAFSIQKHNLG